MYVLFILSDSILRMILNKDKHHGDSLSKRAHYSMNAQKMQGFVIILYNLVENPHKNSTRLFYRLA